MVTNNKVLTVSYGTFSCTLEGFDDSFDAMKAIAEYFRDLAADDRYFGAEPPTPDAEMLTRIAEREIERRVQARQEEGAIVLSAAPKVADTPDPSPEPIQEPVDEVEAPAEVLASEDIADDADASVADVEAIEDTTDPVAETAVEADEVDLQAVMTAASIDVDEDVIEEAPVVADETVAEAAEEFFADAKDEDAEVDFDLDDEDTVNLFEDSVAADAAETSEDAPAPAEDSIAAKLSRIRAVVSRSETSEDDEDDYIEDQHADVSAPIDLDLSEDAPAAESTPEEDNSEEVAAADAPESEVSKPRARVIRMKRAQFEDAIEDGAVEEIAEAPAADEATEETPEPAPEPTPVAETETPVESSLSDEDEADLMAELADLDAELGIEDTAVEAQEAPEATEVAETEAVSEPVAESQEAAEDDQDSARARRRERRASLEAEQPGEEALDRLIEEANTKLDEPEGNRRRSAIAHLRAAVAATKAEKEAGHSFEKEDNSEAYRDDLASTVRTRETQKPERSAPPLKLVAEQRIDAPAAQSSGVRPRRVSIDDVAAAEANEASSNFVEFAENMGATQLPDIMEAAASYLTFVEGRKKFSRPMLMRLAHQMGQDRFEREEGLRSFGQLLRDKKIEKISGGRFTVSEAINFKPDDRAAG